MTLSNNRNIFVNVIMLIAGHYSAGCDANFMSF